MDTIQEIIEKYNHYFSVISVVCASFLNTCRFTSFTWTEQPFALVFSNNRKYFNQAFSNQNVKGIIATPSSVYPSQIKSVHDKSIIVTEKAAELFYYIHNTAIHKQLPGWNNDIPSNISTSASVAPSAIIGNNVTIEDDVEIGPYCVIFDNTRIGQGTVLHPFVTIGTEGFFSKTIMGRKTHVKHFGGVLIGRNCIIHTGTNISRSVNYGEYTLLGDNVHVGIHSNIGHDCRIGTATDISAKVMLAGRVRVGCNCWIGANVAVANAVNVGDGCTLKIGSVVINNIQEGTEVSGNFAYDHRINLKQFLRAIK